MTNLSLYGLLGAGLWILGVACMSLILWDSYRAAGVPALMSLFLCYAPVPLIFDQMIFLSFDASPTNIAYLFTLGFTSLNSKNSPPTEGREAKSSEGLQPASDFTNESNIANEGKSSLSLPISIEKTYVNLHEQAAMDLIKKDLRGQSGIYAFKHNSSNKMYIGSSNNLAKRFQEHLQGRSSNIHLQRGFNKYGLENFTFIVLEFCPNTMNLPLEVHNKVLVKLEQKYLDLIDEKYNINPTAGKSRLGSTHTEETREIFRKINGLKFLGKKHSPEYIKKLRERVLGKNNPMFGKPVTEENKKLISKIQSLPIYIYDAKTLTLINQYPNQKELIAKNSPKNSY